MICLLPACGHQAEVAGHSKCCCANQPACNLPIRADSGKRTCCVALRHILERKCLRRVSFAMCRQSTKHSTNVQPHRDARISLSTCWFPLHPDRQAAIGLMVPDLSCLQAYCTHAHVLAEPVLAMWLLSQEKVWEHGRLTKGYYLVLFAFEVL